MKLNIIGAGLAGCEAAWQAAQQGVKVTLYEMKPEKSSPAHKSSQFAELVCSNSLRADGIHNAVGLLKEEMRRLDSLILSCADQTRVPAGGALAVDREGFSALVTEKITSHPNIEVRHEEVKTVDTAQTTVIAAGPLVSDALAETIRSLTGSCYLHFFDAAAPIVSFESINMEKAFRAARYGKGGDDYINCPMSREEYFAFYDALIHADCADVKDFDSIDLYEGCMPVESMAKRGIDTLRFGPLKPVGLRHPETKEEYYAVVQLRQDNREGTLYNMVGFQTRLKFGEQKRVFGMIPGLAHAEYARYGVMHKNLYIQSPEMLDRTYCLRRDKNTTGIPVYFAGQITGVEGYMESTSSGLVAGINAARTVRGLEPIVFSCATQIGALASYVSEYSGTDFQPMGANFGLLRGIPEDGFGRVRDKRLRKRYMSEHSLNLLKKKMETIGGF